MRGDHPSPCRRLSAAAGKRRGENNFPLKKEASDLDMALPDGTADRAYLEALRDGLIQAFSRARAQLAIYLSGADAYEGDRFGRP